MARRNREHRRVITAVEMIRKVLDGDLMDWRGGDIIIGNNLAKGCEAVVGVGFVQIARIRRNPVTGICHGTVLLGWDSSLINSLLRALHEAFGSPSPKGHRPYHPPLDGTHHYGIHHYSAVYGWYEVQF